MGTLPKRGTNEVHVDAPPEVVYDLIADVARTGEWSHETQSAEWLDGTEPGTPGARFRGVNQQGRNRWRRICEVVTADAPSTFAFRTVPSPLYRDSSLWTFTIEPEDSGTRLTQTFEVLMLNPILDRLFYLLIPEHRDRSAALREDLERLARAAEAAVAPAPVAPVPTG